MKKIHVKVIWTPKVVFNQKSISVFFRRWEALLITWQPGQGQPR